ncbi:MAG: CDP-alcohol phosphatidyltransferase family protein [Promethearchaeota archaeon]
MVLDSKYNSSRLKILVERFTIKFLVGRITANQLTLLGLSLGIISAILFAIPSIFNFQIGLYTAQELLWENLTGQGWNYAWDHWNDVGQYGNLQWGLGDILFLFGILIMFLSFGFDVFDGTLARLTNKTTIFGGIFDIFSDRFVEISLILAIVAYSPNLLTWAGLFSFSAIVLCITIFLLIGGAVSEQQISRMSENQKLIYYAGGVMERTETFIFILLMIIFPVFRLFLLWIFAGLVFFTAFQRLYQAYKLFYLPSQKEKEKEKT